MTRPCYTSRRSWEYRFSRLGYDEKVAVTAENQDIGLEQAKQKFVKRHDVIMIVVAIGLDADENKYKFAFRGRTLVEGTVRARTFADAKGEAWARVLSKMTIELDNCLG